MDHLVDKEIGWMVVLKKLFSKAPWSKQRPVTTRVPWGWYWDQCCSTSLSVARTVGSRAPSASLPMTASCVVQLLHEGRIQRDLDRLERGISVNLMKLN